ncbi:lipoprotein [Hydrogenophilus thermoluteolus]|uniref:outer membrane protein assembly factor BamC n=1 Tax=Hydrogenophilus thermoluteolus TaxID=297 RepID=UPI0024A3D9C8|nr:outer membrane protein assembly factor BamC [Hydrogenophilus thermoluteolus]GLW61139.1 lipoprotein [Hydrogenophilus thermoluteolus]
MAQQVVASGACGVSAAKTVARRGAGVATTAARSGQERGTVQRWGVGLLAGLLGAAVGGCSSFSPNEWLEKKSEIDYKSEKRLERPLEVPPDLINPAQGERFQLPTRRGATSLLAYQSERVQPGSAAAAGASGVLPEQPGMRIERAGDTRWLVVQAAPDQLWPKLKGFWQQLGFTLAVERPDLGVIETDWAENRAKIQDDIIRRTLGKVFDSLYSTGERDKFRTRIEPGKNPGEVEVYISHRGMVEVYDSAQKDHTVWQPRPADPELEAEMLRRLMVFLGAQEEAAKRMVAGAVSQERALLHLDGQRAELELRDGFDRAWRRVGLALDRLGFSVLERDRRAGTYLVRYDDPAVVAEEERKSFWSRLAFWRDDKRPKLNSEYRVRVVGAGEQSRVVVLDESGNAVNDATAKQILEMLYEELR